MRSESIAELLSDIERGKLSLPEFQREYVWNKPRIQDFFQSLYKGYPVGGILLWETDSVQAVHRGNQPPPKGLKTFIVDGQQRLTTLFGVMKGKTPSFFPEDGDEGIFAGLNFDVLNEEFNYSSDDDSAINVSELFSQGSSWSSWLLKKTQFQPGGQEFNLLWERIVRLVAIREIDLHIEEISEEHDLDTVVKIFDKVNSSGTPINRADLALAVISTRWSEVRQEMKRATDRWHSFHWQSHHLLRCMTVHMTGKADYSALHNKKYAKRELSIGLSNTVKSLDKLLDEIQNYLGLDHSYVLRSRNSFPHMVHHLSRWNGFQHGQSEVLRLLCWYVQTIIWRHYAGAGVNRLQVDIDAVTEAKTWDESLKALMLNLRQARGTLEIGPWHFNVSQVNSTYYPFLYLLARATGAKDFGTGVRLSKNMHQQMHLHHLFPKNVLKRKYSSRAEINALANFSFLTSSTNLQISDKKPEQYFPMVEEMCPGALESQWVPKDCKLWKLENYPDFLAARRELLAKAANKLLSNLEAGRLPDA